MTSARANQIDLSFTPFYHCMTRCVRHAYLCGVNTDNGKDYSHRKQWLVTRIKKLAGVFAIKICAYAIMSNHYHLVLFIDASQAKLWNDAQVVSRWSMLFPLDANKIANNDFSTPLMQLKIAQWRQRLMSISWFMRCINEVIARWSNKEDYSSGRFWEGRFKSQALLDEGALLSAMAYVDLNPIRAKIANTLEDSDFTSIQERIRFVSQPSAQKITRQVSNRLPQPHRLMAFNNNQKGKWGLASTIDFTLTDYLLLVDNTGRVIRGDKRGAISNELVPILTRLNLTAQGWMTMTQNLEEQFYRAIGDPNHLDEFGGKINVSAIRGLHAAGQCYLAPMLT